MTTVPKAGDTIGFSYPRHNYLMAPEYRERRRIKVAKVRSLCDEPLDTMTLAMDPLKRRGRILVTGIDLDKKAERSCYFESMASVHPLDPQEYAVAYVKAGKLHSLAAGELTRTQADELAAHLRKAGAAKGVCVAVVHQPISLATLAASA